MKTVRFALVWCMLILGVVLGTILLESKVKNVEATDVVLSERADFTAGFFEGTEAESVEGELKLNSTGSWNTRSWKTPKFNQSDGSTFAADDEFTYMVTAKSLSFMRYLPLEDRWQDLADLPRMVYSGADMVRVGDYIYLIYGGYQDKFSRYQISTNTWTDLKDAPDLIYSGGSLASDGTNIYATRGYNTYDFWKYDVATNTWNTLTGPPATLYTGADLIYDNSTGTEYLFTPRGNNQTTYYRYDIAAGSWSTMAAIPGSINDNSNTIKRNGYIYILRGANTTNFYRYNIASNVWENLESAPIATRYTGLAYNAVEDLIYVFRGNNTYYWWKYDPDTDTYLGATDLPSTPGSGADLVYDNGYVYMLRGNNSTTFYRYEIATGIWTTMAAAPGTFNDDRKGKIAGGYIYYLRGSNTTSFYRYNIAGDSWETLAVSPAAAYYGGSIAYPGSGDYLYVTRGSLTSVFWRYSISTNTWDDAAVADLPVEYESGYGGRLISDGVDIYALTGSGIANLLKYEIGSDTWTVVGDLPFSPYWGTDVIYYNGKIYAQAGYYKTEFWEYTIATGVWRRMVEMPGFYAYDVGPYNGGSLTVDSDTGTLYSINGNNVIRLLSMQIGANNYVSSGKWRSGAIDLSYVSSWGGLSVGSSLPGDSTISLETRSSDDMVSWSEWAAVSGGVIASPVARYIEVRATLDSSTGGVYTPVLESININYTGDAQAPENPDSVNASSQQVGGEALVDGGSYSYAFSSPYFSFSGASDTETGVAGYYVYFGSDSNADPESEGNFQINSTYVVTKGMSSGNYYLRVKTKDGAGNISGAATLFTYVYSGVSPSLGIGMSDSSMFGIGETSQVQVLGDMIKLEGKAGFWEQERGEYIPGGVRYGTGFAYVEESNTLYTFRGNNTNSFYAYDIETATWSALAVAPAAVYQGGDLIEGPDGFLYGMPGRNLNSFWRYDIVNDSWSDEAAMDSPLSFYYGSSLIYDGSEYIYATRGNNDDTFMRYSTLNNTWETLANTDFGSPSSTPNNNVYIGGDMAYDGEDTIYLMQGGTYAGFASYSISGDSWEALETLPAKVYDGGQLEYDGDNNALYMTPGWTTDYFFKYDLSTQSWSQLEKTPMTFNNGSAMRRVGDKIYALRGNSQQYFFVYSISKNSWQRPITGIFGPSSNGTDYRAFGYGAQVIKGDGDNYYVFRGNFDSVMTRYNESTGELVRLSKAPVGLYQGSAVTYAEDKNKLYLTGNRYSRRFWEYDIATDKWSEVSTDQMPVDPGGGSSMDYDGSRYIYWNRGNGGANFYRYDMEGEAGSRWGTLANIPAGVNYGAHLVYKNGYVYTLRGSNTNPNPFYRYEVASNSWTTMSSLPDAVYIDGFLVDGGNDYLYACRAYNNASCYRYSIGGDSWESIANMPANAYYGAAASTGDKGRMMALSGNGGANNVNFGMYSYVLETENTSFKNSGTWTSTSMDLGQVYRFANLKINFVEPENTSISVETRSSADNVTYSSWTAVSEEKSVGSERFYKVNSQANRYLQVRISLASGNGLYSSKVNSFMVEYYQDLDKPSNASALTAYETATKSATLVNGAWSKAASPLFDWPNADEVGGATDGEAGSGVAGYYVYFGTSASGDPVSQGSLVNVSEYSPGSLTSGESYYLRIKTKDDAGNVTEGTWDAFNFRYDGVKPSNPTTLVVDPPGYSSADSFNFSWSGAEDTGSGVAGYCYKTGAVDSEEVCVNEASVSAIPSYRTGTNTFYVRTIDTAGNLATEYITGSYYFSNNAPSGPQNLRVTPETSSTNEFAFAWDPPSLYYGQQSALKYYYSVNVLPTVHNVNAIGLSDRYLTAGAYATQKGKNTFYVVAKDEAGNIDYNVYTAIDFYAETEAPGVPRNIDISDVSIKETESWRLALSWDAPSSSGSGVSMYKVYRTKVATDCNNDFSSFTYVAATSQTSYVDTGLTQEDQYYCVKSCDSTNECSAPSDTVDLYPDGRWRVPPSLISGPESSVKTKSALVSWSTNRTSSSFVKYGKSSGDYGEEVGSSDQVASHVINLVGLDPGTTYYYKALWTDEDGNTGESEEFTLETNPAPVVSTVEIVDVSLFTAFVKFTLANATSATIQYGPSTSYGLTHQITTGKEEGEYMVKLEDLEEGSIYHLNLVAEDEEGNLFTSDDYTFETLPVPKLANIKVQQVRGMPTSTLRLLWTSNTGVSSIVTYYPKGRPEMSKDQINLTLSLNHQVIVTNLEDDTEYVVLIKGRDVAGNEAEVSKNELKTSADLRPPLISDLVAEGSVSGVGDQAKAQIIVTWNTDEPATSQIEYGLGTGSEYPNKTQEDVDLTSNHSVTITDLKPASVYHLKVVTKDRIGNVTESFDSVVVTPKATKSAFDLVVGSLSKSFGFVNGLSGGL